MYFLLLVYIKKYIKISSLSFLNCMYVTQLMIVWPLKLAEKLNRFGAVVKFVN